MNRWNWQSFIFSVALTLAALLVFGLAMRFLFGWHIWFFIFIFPIFLVVGSNMGWLGSKPKNGPPN